VLADRRLTERFNERSRASFSCVSSCPTALQDKEQCRADASKTPCQTITTQEEATPLRRPMSRVAYAGDDGDDPPAPQIRPLPRMIPKAEVLRLASGVTFPTVWRWMKDGTFPMSFDVLARPWRRFHTHRVTGGAGSCRRLQCCEPTAEERGAVKPHATFCGNRGRATRHQFVTR